MRQHSANSPLSPAAAAALDLFFATEAPGCNSWVLRQRHQQEFARLHALPDGALNAMGLTRDALPRWLFRHEFGWR